MQLIYLDYADSDLIDKPLPWQLKGLSYTRTGYGSRIPTSKMIRHNGRLKRVYCMIYSNSGTCYIMNGKDKLILR